VRRVRADSKEIRSRWSDANTAHPERNGDEGGEREDVGVASRADDDRLQKLAGESLPFPWTILPSRRRLEGSGPPRRFISSNSGSVPAARSCSGPRSSPVPFSAATRRDAKAAGARGSELC